MRVKHRTLLRAKELRLLRKRLAGTPSLIHRALRAPSSGKTSVERVILDDKSELYLVGGEFWLAKLTNTVYPGLPALLSGNVEIPKVVVDMGAVPHISNGADVMAPGITELEKTLAVGDLTVIIDQKNRVPIAVGRMLLNPTVILETKRGRAIETLHYVGDQLWKLAKELSE